MGDSLSVGASGEGGVQSSWGRGASTPALGPASAPRGVGAASCSSQGHARRAGAAGDLSAAGAQGGPLWPPPTSTPCTDARVSVRPPGTWPRSVVPRALGRCVLEFRTWSPEPAVRTSLEKGLQAATGSRGAGKAGPSPRGKRGDARTPVGHPARGGKRQREDRTCAREPGRGSRQKRAGQASSGLQPGTVRGGRLPLKPLV